MKLYRARRSAEVTPRYFVDRFPVFLNRASVAPVLTFTYVDSGAVRLEGFGTHLHAYLALFQGLPAFEFVYIAPTPRLFQAAESPFQQVVNGRRLGGKSVSLLDYFRLRKAWDARERVASADVVLLKEAQRRYAGKQFDELYERWGKRIAKDSDVMRFAEQAIEAPRSVFRTHLCSSSLRAFADPLGNSAENLAGTRFERLRAPGFR